MQSRLFVLLAVGLLLGVPSLSIAGTETDANGFRTLAEDFETFGLGLSPSDDWYTAENCPVASTTLTESTRACGATTAANSQAHRAFKYQAYTGFGTPDGCIGTLSFKAYVPDLAVGQSVTLSFQPGGTVIVDGSGQPVSGPYITLSGAGGTGNLLTHGINSNGGTSGAGVPLPSNVGPGQHTITWKVEGCGSTGATAITTFDAQGWTDSIVDGSISNMRILAMGIGQTGIQTTTITTYLDDVVLNGQSDGDGDGDGIIDLQDNCPNTPNANQMDRDGDGVGNACDGLNVLSYNFTEDFEDDIVGQYPTQAWYTFGTDNPALSTTNGAVSVGGNPNKAFTVNNHPGGSIERSWHMLRTDDYGCGINQIEFDVKATFGAGQSTPSYGIAVSSAPMIPGTVSGTSVPSGQTFIVIGNVQNPSGGQGNWAGVVSHHVGQSGAQVSEHLLSAPLGTPISGRWYHFEVRWSCAVGGSLYYKVTDTVTQTSDDETFTNHQMLSMPYLTIGCGYNCQTTGVVASYDNIEIGGAYLGEASYDSPTSITGADLVTDKDFGQAKAVIIREYESATQSDIRTLSTDELSEIAVFQNTNCGTGQGVGGYSSDEITNVAFFTCNSDDGNTDRIRVRGVTLVDRNQGTCSYCGDLGEDLTIGETNDIPNRSFYATNIAQLGSVRFERNLNGPGPYEDHTPVTFAVTEVGTPYWGLYAHFNIDDANDHDEYEQLTLGPADGPDGLCYYRDPYHEDTDYRDENHLPIAAATGVGGPTGFVKVYTDVSFNQFEQGGEPQYNLMTSMAAQAGQNSEFGSGNSIACHNRIVNPDEVMAANAANECGACIARYAQYTAVAKQVQNQPTTVSYGFISETAEVGGALTYSGTVTPTFTIEEAVINNGLALSPLNLVMATVTNAAVTIWDVSDPTDPVATCQFSKPAGTLIRTELDGQGQSLYLFTSEVAAYYNIYNCGYDPGAPSFLGNDGAIDPDQDGQTGSEDLDCNDDGINDATQTPEELGAVCNQQQEVIEETDPNGTGGASGGGLGRLEEGGLLSRTGFALAAAFGVDEEGGAMLLCLMLILFFAAAAGSVGTVVEKGKTIGRGWGPMGFAIGAALGFALCLILGLVGLLAAFVITTICAAIVGVKYFRERGG